jgi:(E)-4-hydroxy-3-methylbut-2-enyl-diphosphate synthase
MVQAYRLLVQTLLETGEVFPLHLGVTEAGDGEDGRIKSAIGIGALLEDGIGDTVRVSLTEAPEAEMPVAKLLVDRYANRNSVSHIPKEEIPIDFFAYSRRNTHEVLNIGGKNVPRVFGDYSNRETITAASLFAVGYAYSIDMDKWNLSDSACDYLFVGKNTVNFEIPGTLGVVMEHATWLQQKNRDRHYPIFSSSDYIQPNERSGELNFVEVELEDLMESFLSVLKSDSTVVLLLKTSHECAVQHRRTAIFRLMNHGVTCPVVLSSTYNIEEEAYTLYSSTDVGALLLDGLGDGVLISNTHSSLAKSNAIAFGILQATRTRISRTEYISCPSCGRTLFDLQETTAKIRSRTSHLKGVKIGIMGCIVNGPGEMADADYGYVGTGVGKITLYKEKNVVKKNIDEAEAVDELISLIKEYGDWVEA